MLPEHIKTQIEDWLDGTLGADEKTAFEAEMRGNPALEAEVRLHRAIRQAMREREVGVFRQTVDALLDAADSTSAARREKRMQLPRVILALAASLLLILAAIWFFQQTVGPGPDQLYSEAFRPPVQFGFKGMQYAVRDTSALQSWPEWSRLNEAWMANNLDEALRIALEIAQTDTAVSRSQSAWYAAGVIALSKKNTNAALEYLEKAGSVDPFGEDIIWYKALSRVQQYIQKEADQFQSVEALRRVLDSPQPDYRHRWAERMLHILQP